MTLNFTVHNREGLLCHIADNLTDLAIMVRPPLDMDTVHQPFAPHPYIIVAAADHPLVGSVRIPSETAHARALRRPRTGSDTWNSMEEGFGGDLGGYASRWRSAAPKRSSRR